MVKLVTAVEALFRFWLHGVIIFFESFRVNRRGPDNFILRYLRSLQSAPAGRLSRLLLWGALLQVVMYGGMLAVLGICAHLPEPTLAGAFRSSGIDPDSMDRGRVRLRVTKWSRSFDVLYGDTVVRRWLCATGPGIPDGAAAPGKLDLPARAAMMFWLFPGAKQFQGDFRTPEGRYHLATDFSPSRYHRFALVSYPDAGDRKRSKNPGGSVGIHGVLTEMKPLGRLHFLARWTRGCIALTNDQVDALDPYVGPGTSIEILP